MKADFKVEFTAKAGDVEFKEESVTFHNPEELFAFVAPGGGCETIPDQVREIQMVFTSPLHPNVQNPIADVPVTLELGMVFFTGPLSEIAQTAMEILDKAGRGELSDTFLTVLGVGARSSFLHWSPSMSVGIDFMDADHKQLIELLTELHDLVGPGQVQTAAVAKLDELIDFTQQHFHLEERLMEESDYDELGEHRQLHKALLQEIGECRQNLISGEMDAGPEIMDFLKDWLTRHIRESDKHFGGFLEGRLGRGKGSKLL